MSMNIYITSENQQYIRRYAEDEKGTMSGLVNRLLADYFKTGGKHPAVSAPNVAPVFESQNKVTQDEIRKQVAPRVVNVPATSFCEHGQLKGQCLAKKCKYGRSN
jgi:hypothetical protein